MAETRQISKEKLMKILREAKELGVQRLKFGDVEVEFAPKFDDLPDMPAGNVDRVSYEHHLFSDGVN